MAWTYFTGSLGAAALITRAQRNELWAAFIERAEAAGEEDYAIDEDLRDSGMNTDLVLWFASPVRLLAAINAISALYVRTDLHSGTATISAATTDLYYDNEATDDTNVLVEAAEALGYVYGDVAALLASPFVDSTLRWNIARKAIQLLCRPRLAYNVDQRSYEKIGYSLVDWETARDDCIANSETESDPTELPGPIFSAGYSGDFNVSATRHEVDITVPAATPFSAGYLVHGWRKSFLDAPATPLVELNFDGASIEISAPDTGTDKTREALTGSRTATGEITMSLQYGAGYDEAEADLFEPVPAGDEDRGADSEFTGFFAAPTFTHP